MENHSSVVHRLRIALTLIRAMAVYWIVIFPRARRELRYWGRFAATMPDPVLRKQAIDKLREEHLSAEGAAAFAILAAPRRRKRVIRLCVAFEVMYDLLDGLGEQPAVDTLANNRRLHSALADALGPSAPTVDYYAFHQHHGDGGYLGQLVATCQREMTHLPARGVVTAALARSATRASEAQSLNHAGLHLNPRAFATSTKSPLSGHDPGLYWWETAAAAGSPLGIFALVAAASHPHTTPQAATDIESAYYPWIAALHWLLDSLVDRGDDLGTGNPSYVSHYDSPHHARDRLALISKRANADAQRLPYTYRHTLLLAGMVALNVSHAGASTDLASPAISLVVDELRGPVAPLLFALRLRRHIARLSTDP